MSLRAPILSIGTIALAAGLSFVVEQSQHAETRRVSESWAQTHASMSAHASLASGADPYWTWRAPVSNDRLAALAAADATVVLSAGAGQEVWAINAAASRDIHEIPLSMMPLIALSTAAFLGIDIEDEHGQALALEIPLLASLNPWQTEMKTRCGDCAPAASTLPPTSSIVPSRGISIAVERIRRSAVPYQGKPMAVMVQRIREGGLPSEEEWSTRGLSGMAALELGVSDRRDQLPRLLLAAQDGPSATDRIAALWVIWKMGETTTEITKIKRLL